MKSSEELLLDALGKVGTRRRQRRKGWYMTPLTCEGHSGISFIFDRPKRVRKCPYCGKLIRLFKEVDEFELDTVRATCSPMIIFGKELC